MEDKRIEVHTNLSISEYIFLVNEIVDGYFYDGEDNEVLNIRNGEYVPHIGNLNAMRLFYNYCMTGNGYGVPHNVKDALEMEAIVKDEDFIRMFNESIAGDGYMQIDFANAYACAIELIDIRLNSTSTALDKLKAHVVDIINKLGDVVNNLDTTSLTAFLTGLNENEEELPEE